MGKSKTYSSSPRQEERIPFWSIAVSTSIIAASTGVVGLWLLFRRSCKYLTSQDLPSTISKDGIEPVQQLTPEERIAIKTAFLSGDDFQWLVAGKDYKTMFSNTTNQRERHHSQKVQQQHQEVTFQFIEYLLSFAERYGHLLVCRNQNNVFLGAIGLIPPYRSQTLFALHFYRSVLPIGMPLAVSLGTGPAARCQAFAMVETTHKEYMKGIPHWYVQIMGVVNDAQGRGIGRKLMEAAIVLANNMPIYLDCHNGNVPFYEKCGFVVGRKFEIVPRGAINDDDMSTFEMNGMVRNMPMHQKHKIAS